MTDTDRTPHTPTPQQSPPRDNTRPPKDLLAHTTMFVRHFELVRALQADGLTTDTMQAILDFADHQNWVLALADRLSRDPRPAVRANLPGLLTRLHEQGVPRQRLRPIFARIRGGADGPPPLPRFLPHDRERAPGPQVAQPETGAHPAPTAGRPPLPVAASEAAPLGGAGEPAADHAARAEAPTDRAPRVLGWIRGHALAAWHLQLRMRATGLILSIATSCIVGGLLAELWRAA